MSKRTLPDELRSVLRSHSLDAPDPDETVERILADTVASGSRAATPAGHGRWRPSVSLIGAVASVALLVAGVAAIRAANDSDSNKASSGSAAMATQPGGDALSGPGYLNNGAKAAQGYGEPSTQPPLPTDLNCPSSVPGSKVVTGAHTSFRAGAKTVFVFEFYCLAANGQRGGSQIEAFQQAGNQLHYLSTSIEAQSNSHLQSMTGGVDSVTLTGTSGDGRPRGNLVSLRMTTKDGGLTFDGATHLIAAACQAKDLTAKVLTVEQVSATDGHIVPGHFVLQLTNHSTAPCALEGYPTLVGARDGTVVGPSLLATLRGPAGGLKAAVPPIIELAPGSTAGAIIEAGLVHPSCAPTPQLSVKLANGVALGPVQVTLSGCGEQVHPFVNSPQGNG
jgi:hypothetical protein